MTTTPTSSKIGGIIYPAEHERVAHDFRDALKDNSIATAILDLAELGNKNKNSEDLIDRSDIVFAIGTSPEAGTFEHEIRHASTTKPPTPVFPIKVAGQYLKVAEGDPEGVGNVVNDPIGEIHDICRSYFVSDYLISKASVALGHPDPFLADEANWAVLDELLRRDPSNKPLAAGLLHTGFWHQLLRDLEAIKPERIKLKLLEALNAGEIKILKDVHSFHPRLSNYFLTLDMHLKKVKALPDLDPHTGGIASGPFQSHGGFSPRMICASGIGASLKGARLNFYHTFPDNKLVESLDILIHILKKLEISPQDCVEITDDDWLSIKENTLSILDGYKEKLDMSDGNLPFIKRTMRDNLSFESYTDILRKMSRSYLNLAKDSIHLSYKYFGLYILRSVNPPRKPKHFGKIINELSARTYQPLSSRVVTNSNDCIMSHLDLIEAAMKEYSS